MIARVHQLQGLQRLTISHFRRTLSRSVHQSAQRNVALPSSQHLLPTQQAEGSSQSAPTKPVLGRLPTSTVLRSYLITGMSSSPALLSICFNILRRMLDSKSWLMSIERNPVLSQILKKTFYAQFCVGERKDEVVANTNFAREVLGYDGILFEYALEVLGGTTPTAEETAKEIETWRKGMLQSVEMAKEGDFVGLKYVFIPHPRHSYTRKLKPFSQMVRPWSSRPALAANPSTRYPRNVVRHNSRMRRRCCQRRLPAPGRRRRSHKPRSRIVDTRAPKEVQPRPRNCVHHLPMLPTQHLSTPSPTPRARK